MVDHLAMLLGHPLVAEQLEYRAFYRQQISTWQRLAAGEDRVEAPKQRWWHRLLRAIPES